MSKRAKLRRNSAIPTFEWAAAHCDHDFGQIQIGCRCLPLGQVVDTAQVLDEVARGCRACWRNGGIVAARCARTASTVETDRAIKVRFASRRAGADRLLYRAQPNSASAIRDRRRRGATEAECRKVSSRDGPAHTALRQDGFSSNRHPALAYCLRMMFSDLPSPAEASSHSTNRATGFAQAGNRYHPRIKCGAGFFGIMC